MRKLTILRKEMIKCYFFYNQYHQKIILIFVKFANSNGGYNDLQYGKYDDFINIIMSKKLIIF